jgi:hypothetical protein
VSDFVKNKKIEKNVVYLRFFIIFLSSKKKAYVKS